jgi:dihydropteroate synthase
VATISVEVPNIESDALHIDIPDSAATFSQHDRGPTMTSERQHPEPAVSGQSAATWAGLTLDRPRVMGILNVTRDSFSDGGRHDDLRAAIDAGLALADAGADIVDVGGESTRPGAAAVAPEEEQERVVPVIRALARAGLRVSVDTRNASTMRAALDAGALIVNDVSALTHDPAAVRLVAERRCPVVLMHMRGTPADMNSRAVYADVVGDVTSELADRLDAALRGGVAPEAIALDPGIGFAKLAEHSVALLRGLSQVVALGQPVLVGVSRKSFIGRLTDEPDPGQRVAGSLAAGLFAVLQGISILRVHDVRETVQALTMWHHLTQ